MSNRTKNKNYKKRKNVLEYSATIKRPSVQQMEELVAFLGHFVAEKYPDKGRPEEVMRFVCDAVNDYYDNELCFGWLFIKCVRFMDLFDIADDLLTILANLCFEDGHITMEDPPKN
ncbi:MAG: hypothetical protein HQK60_08845 [Deltaproteobacteria bacterium]|nr:hypothetical protein [Deltaproteobacteria bacterium]